MRKRLWPAIAIVSVCLTLTACGGPPKDGGKYSSLVGLRKAYTDAGFPCKNWTHKNNVTHAKQSGTCGSDSVLSIYASADDLDQQLSDVRDLNKSLGVDDSDPWLVGQNWIVNAPHLKAVQAKLGGKIESINP